MTNLAVVVALDLRTIDGQSRVCLAVRVHGAIVTCDRMEVSEKGLGSEGDRVDLGVRNDRPYDRTIRLWKAGED